MELEWNDLKRPMCLKFAVWPAGYWEMVKPHGEEPGGRLETTAGFRLGHCVTLVVPLLVFHP